MSTILLRFHWTGLGNMATAINKEVWLNQVLFFNFSLKKRVGQGAA